MKTLLARLLQAIYDIWQNLVFKCRDNGLSELLHRWIDAFRYYFSQVLTHIKVARAFPKYKQLRFLLHTYATVAFLIFPLVYLGTGIEESDPPQLTSRIGRAVYFSIITITTTGYGDISPDMILSRSFACLEVAIGFVIVVFAIPALTSH